MRGILIFLLSFLCATVTHGQDIINGIVADSATFAPLSYVNIRIKGQNKGTITDEQGNFRIVASPSDTLQISFVGYETVELPVENWQPSMIMLAEKSTLMNTVTVQEKRMDPYEGMFDEENALWREQNKKLPFYYTKRKKQNIKIQRLGQENMRVQTYVDVVITNENNKKRLMETYHLDEKEYYDLLGRFNSMNYTVMYYLTAGELVSLLNAFFEKHAPRNQN